MTLLLQRSLTFDNSGCNCVWIVRTVGSVDGVVFITVGAMPLKSINTVAIDTRFRTNVTLCCVTVLALLSSEVPFSVGGACLLS